MRDLILHICRWLLPLFGVSAIASCEKGNNTNDTPCEYGTPVMEYHICGRVTDAKSGVPVKGIEVTYVREYMNPDNSGTVLTSDNGEFVCSGKDFPSTSATLKFTDNDGPDNAGDFQTKEVKVTLVKKDGTENGWYVGVYEAENVIVELAQVEETVKE